MEEIISYYISDEIENELGYWEYIHLMDVMKIVAFDEYVLVGMDPRYIEWNGKNERETKEKVK